MSLSKEKLVESKFGRFRAFDGFGCYGKGVAAFAILLGLPWESAITDLSEDGQFYYYFDNSSGWCQIVLKPLKYGVFIYNPATGDFVGPLFIVRNSVVASTKHIRLHFNGKSWENQVVLRKMRNTKSLLCETRPNENRHYDPRHDAKRKRTSGPPDAPKSLIAGLWHPDDADEVLRLFQLTPELLSEALLTAQPEEHSVAQPPAKQAARSVAKPVHNKDAPPTAAFHNLNVTLNDDEVDAFIAECHGSN